MVAGVAVATGKVLRQASVEEALERLQIIGAHPDHPRTGLAELRHGIGEGLYLPAYSPG